MTLQIDKNLKLGGGGCGQGKRAGKQWDIAMDSDYSLQR